MTAGAGVRRNPADGGPAEIRPLHARLVELRYFAGLTVEEAGKAIGISTATAYRHWNYARAWLFSELQGTAES